MILEFVRAIGGTFSPEAYLVLTRIQGSLWTLADFVIVFYLIRIADLMRLYIGHRRHRFSYAVLAATLPFALLLPFAPTGGAFFRLELLVTVPHFLLILYVCAADPRHAARALAKRVRAEE